MGEVAGGAWWKVWGCLWRMCGWMRLKLCGNVIEIHGKAMQGRSEPPRHGKQPSQPSSHPPHLPPGVPPSPRAIYRGYVKSLLLLVLVVLPSCTEGQHKQDYCCKGCNTLYHRDDSRINRVIVRVSVNRGEMASTCSHSWHSCSSAAAVATPVTHTSHVHPPSHPPPYSTLPPHSPSSPCPPPTHTQDAIWQAEGVLLCNMVAAQNKLGQYKAAVEETCPDLFRK